MRARTETTGTVPAAGASVGRAAPATVRGGAFGWARLPCSCSTVATSAWRRSMASISAFSSLALATWPLTSVSSSAVRSRFSVVALAVRTLAASSACARWVRSSASLDMAVCLGVKTKTARLSAVGFTGQARRRSDRVRPQRAVQVGCRIAQPVGEAAALRVWSTRGGNGPQRKPGNYLNRGARFRFIRRARSPPPPLKPAGAGRHRRGWMPRRRPRPACGSRR
jgi:hypothetical protein